MEMIIPVAMMAATGAKGVMDQKARTEAAEAARYQRQVEMAQEKAATANAIAKKSQEADLTASQNARLLAEKRAEMIKDTGQNFTAPVEGVLRAFNEAKLDKLTNEAGWLKAGSDDFQRSGRRTIANADRAYRTATIAGAVGTLGGMFGSAMDSNLLPMPKKPYK